MEYSHKIDVLQGLLALTWTSIAFFVHEATPVVAFIGALSGAILGIHGVYCLISQHWVLRRRTRK